MHVLRGLQQAAITVLGCLAVAVVAALAWVLLADGSFLRAFAVTLIVLAVLVGTAGSAAFSRLADHEERAFLGMGPERDASNATGALTPLGVSLFVGLPLFVAGLVLLDVG